MQKKGKLNILVTAGPTREYIDPLRYITNLSTGVMGYEIAKAALCRRHTVTLISGPTNIVPPRNLRVINVTTAQQMKQAVDSVFKNCHCLVMAAAVSDFRPKIIHKHKIKQKRSLTMTLEKTPDILAGLSSKKGRRIFVGFSLETENLIENAGEKLKNKNLDLIVANEYTRKNNPFGKNKTSLYLIDKAAKKEWFRNITKRKFASIILDKIEKMWYIYSLPIK
ncbi:MAG: phosphopantothenoylcysteine decarboxylase [Candidatus Omnitrophota bacterium]